MKQTFFIAIEKAANQFLKQDPEFFPRLASYQDHVASIELLGLNLKFFVQVGLNQLHILSEFAGEVDTEIRGYPFSLLHLSIHQKQSNAFLRQRVQINGDLEFAEHLIKLLNDFEFDWEEPLSQWIGDSATQFLSEGLSSIGDFKKKSFCSFQDNLSAYLQDEIQLIPSEAELREFYKNVDQVRDDTARLDAKLKLLEQRLNHEKN